MNKLMILLVLLAVKSAYSLDCFHCDSKQVKDCKGKPDDKFKITCGKAAKPTYTTACLKRVYTDASNEEVIERKCLVYDKDYNSDCSHNLGDKSPTFCEACTDNLCNTAPATHVGFATVLCAIVVFLLK